MTVMRGSLLTNTTTGWELHLVNSSLVHDDNTTDNVTTQIADNETSLASGIDADVFNRLSPFYMVYIPCVLVLGVLGNVVSAVIMMRERFRTMNISAYLFVLAIVDTAQLLTTSVLRRWLWMVSGVSWTTLSDPVCKMRTFILKSSGYTSSCLLVAVTIDRVIAVTLPHRYTMDRSRAWIVVSLTTILTFIPATVQVVSNHVYYWGPMIFCFYDDGFLGPILEFMDVLLYSIVPSLVITICNVVLVRTVWRSIQFRKTHSQSDGRRERQMERLTWMLMFTTLTFSLLTLPHGIFSFHNYLSTTYTPNFPAWHLSLQTLSMTNHSINGFIYCFSGPLFREELRKLFSWKSKK